VLFLFVPHSGFDSEAVNVLQPCSLSRREGAIFDFEILLKPFTVLVEWQATEILRMTGLFDVIDQFVFIHFFLTDETLGDSYHFTDQ
jgi:hypothetical protein